MLQYALASGKLDPAAREAAEEMAAVVACVRRKHCEGSVVAREMESLQVRAAGK